MSESERLHKRWEAGKAHHPKALEFLAFIRKEGIDDELGDFKTGDDGDNGEDFTLALSEFFESLEPST